MASKHSAILRGYVDFYCLVCEKHFLDEDDVNSHIVEETHVKNLEGNCFLEKYKDDCIRKVKKGYFCEFCNILLSTAAKVGLHVCEESHMNNKGAQSLTRVFKSELGVLAFNNTMISQEAWNGFIDNTCVICNTEFDDETEHRNESAHIMNLVQSKVVFAVKHIYRKIDDTSFQCLTCNSVLADNSLTSHFDSATHMQYYKSCLYNVEAASMARALMNFSEERTQTETKAPGSEVKKPETPLAAEKPAQTIKKPVANPPKPSTTTEVPKKIEIPNPVKKRNTVTPPKVTQEFEDVIMSSLDAKDYIISDEHGEKCCLLCDWTMDSLIINNHVNGKHHAVMLNMHKKRLDQKIVETKTIEDTPNSDVVEVKTKNSDFNDEIDRIITNFQDFVRIEMGKAVCTKCSKVLDLDPQFISAHIEEHKRNVPKKEEIKPSTSGTATGAVQKVDETKRRPTKEKESRPSSVASKADKESRASSVASSRDDEEVEKFAKDNNLIYHRKDSKVFCQICDSLVPSSLKSMREHIIGTSHKNRASRKQQQSTIKKPMDQFLTSARAIENGIMKDIVINEKFCLNILSFMTIVFLDGERSKCEGCEIILDRVDQIEEHVSSDCHQKVMGNLQVTVSPDEFLRDIRPETVHCGFCNLALHHEDLSTHQSSTLHKEAKTYSFWRLLQYQQYSDIDPETKNLDIHMNMFVKLLSEELF